MWYLQLRIPENCSSTCTPPVSRENEKKSLKEQVEPVIGTKNTLKSKRYHPTSNPGDVKLKDQSHHPALLP
jgi:hypothetical protein